MTKLILRPSSNYLSSFWNDNIFDDFFNDSLFFKSNFKNEFTPNADIAETDKSFEFSFDLPGVKKSDLSIEMNNGNITISGERKMENNKNGKNYHSLESSYGKFSRSFELPTGINENKINAKFIDGILNISIPKDEKKIVKNTIQIK
ncbi:MAG: heat-shock protein Hsp20 [Flammeovirgaceae bacterium]|nr:heat-shock protein Hsp20 [Flammeovirgaceae bacterium]|tara:strand:- start:950 stop:1390 length:441 start_codon:yes stop_codon:yes gene_type:complete